MGKEPTSTGRGRDTRVNGNRTSEMGRVSYGGLITLST